MNSAEVFDRNVYDGLVGDLGADDVAEVLGAFLADTQGKLDRLMTGSFQREEVRREAHAIKSSAATFGFVELSRLAKDAEKSAPALSPDGLREAVGGLQQSFVQVRRLTETLLPAREIAG